jgi:hypothetical protein
MQKAQHNINRTGRQQGKEVLTCRFQYAQGYQKTIGRIGTGNNLPEETARLQACLSAPARVNKA